jgi:DNA-binding winged helix-turn-helix (wHTH) protein
MSSSPSDISRGTLRFGVFEADLATGELRKNGAKVRLQEQPFQVLVALLERPGQMVSREDLRLRLWPADTFVDFDHSLNTAINKLRDALGDVAANPRFIETLARRGYRFIAPVQMESRETPAPSATSPLPSESTLELPAVHRGLTRTLFALLQIMYLSFYVPALMHLDEVRLIASAWSTPETAMMIVIGVMLTACAGIPLRFYLLTAAGFDYPQLGTKFARLYPAVFALDLLWALSPFLLRHRIGSGAALAAVAALLYVPFAERTLLRMTYRDSRPRS